MHAYLVDQHEKLKGGGGQRPPKGLGFKWTDGFSYLNRLDPLSFKGNPSLMMYLTNLRQPDLKLSG